MTRPTDERGQVLSSLVAVLAVVAIVAGLLVLFGTRGGDSLAQPAAQSSSPATTAPGTPSTTPSGEPSGTPSSEPTSGPTSESTSGPSEPPATDTPTTAPTTVPTTAPTTVPTLEHTDEPTSVPPPRSTVPPSERPAVEVYNNTNRKGLAQDVANRARRAGWTVSGADNWHGKIVTSTVYYPAGMQAEAAQLAQDIGVNRIKGALDNMKKDRLTVILTTDYSG